MQGTVASSATSVFLIVAFATEAFSTGACFRASAFARCARLFRVHEEGPRLQRLYVTRPLISMPGQGWVGS